MPPAIATLSLLEPAPGDLAERAPSMALPAATTGSTVHRVTTRLATLEFAGGAS